MKRVLIAIIMAVSVLASQANELTEMGLLGKVKSVEEKVYFLFPSNGKYELGKVQSRWIYFYDSKGKKTEGNGYNEDGSLALKLVCAYDAKGIKTEEIYYKADKKIDSKIIYTYDAKKNLTEEAYYNSAGILYLTASLTYNSQRNLINKTVHYLDNTVDMAKVIYTYDARGFCTEEAWFKADGSLESRSVNVCDARGNRIKKTTFNYDGSITATAVYTYEYDERKNWIKQTESKEVTMLKEILLEPNQVIIRIISYYP